ncbi:MAG TPA: serine hydrolase domain-containing protein, partial [Emcibacteraceae bacterium]|nr:serine hydrolase domain-containing protein [Emcibacteraceae bacterium]
MKKMIVLAVMGLLMSCSSEKSMDGGENALDQKFKEVDKIFADYEGADKPGAAVMIIQDGKVIFQKGYGMANLEENIPVTPKSDFRLASVTKEFTSMSILQLIERGQLTLETTLTDIFPE